MSESLRTMFLILIFAGIITMQFNMDADKTATRQIKNALELAVHDAALELDNLELAQGDIVFNVADPMNPDINDPAFRNFVESLTYNLKLDSSSGWVYRPTSESYYQHGIILEYIEFVDDRNSTFPTNYINNEYDIVDTLDGPSIIAVISTRSPRYFVGDGIIVRKAVVYEYAQ